MIPWLQFAFALDITTHMKNGQSGREMMHCILHVAPL
jgi:hypothetical protein